MPSPPSELVHYVYPQWPGLAVEFLGALDDWAVMRWPGLACPGLVNLTADGRWLAGVDLQLYARNYDPRPGTARN